MQTRRLPVLTLIAVLAACDATGSLTDDLGPDADDGLGDLGSADLGVEPVGMLDERGPDFGDVQVTNIAFTDSGASLVNPERGYYIGVNLLSTTSAASVRAAGHSLAIALVYLDAYRNAPIDQAFLDRLNAGFNSARAAGIKVILRFMYNNDGGRRPRPTK